MKNEWRKEEKSIYLPKNKPEVMDIPEYQYVVISGQGNPNSASFAKHIEVLYSLSYAIKMTLKKEESKPSNYNDWTVYPLEGVWSITEEAQKNFKGEIDKDDLIFDLMIRQPDFVTEEFFERMRELVRAKKPQKLLDEVRFEKIKEGECIQMLHIGSYDDEVESFTQMEAFAKGEGMERISKIHREIYLSDFRKVPVDKLKTVLRFQIKH